MKRLPFRVTPVVVVLVALSSLIFGPRFVDSIVKAIVSLQNANAELTVTVP